MELNKQFNAFYKTWLAVYITDAVLNVIMYTYLIGPFIKRELSKIGLDRIDRDKPATEIQLASYAIVIAIILFFIINSIPKKNRKALGSLYGALFGVIIFLIHNLFNFAIFKDWSLALVIIDSSWGILQGVMIGFLGVYFYDRFNK